jgi:arginase
VHISFDLDAMDPRYFKATGVPVPGGFLPSHLAELAQFIQTVKNLRSMDIVEFNPDLATNAADHQASLSVFHILMKALARGLRQKHPEAQNLTL